MSGGAVSVRLHPQCCHAYKSHILKDISIIHLIKTRIVFSHVSSLKMVMSELCAADL